ncbi:glycine betaine/proline transport system substrate-binding protein [Carnobacterium iners]|uniref:Glycine betaine/proline transport system substrate-binding protein n=1 Tax=Carnobacterium iners TaxID=1073423 RepID=A0A1X7NKL7_9LACT|nr:glycine betaine/proline transport system substrate-binding protein [Carnobacterium iners]SMH38402.1 glycine betaine/proline transport system substrate-binding protein [Carnobacterium iners]
MKKNNFNYLGILTGLALSLFATGCASDDAQTTKDDSVGKGQKIDLAYVEWDTEVASTNVIGTVLEDLGYDVNLISLDNAIMWEAVSNGEADAMVAAWLPETNAAHYEKYGKDLENLGENLSGAKLGLVVPEYMDVESIEDLTNEANKAITGIEPGASIVAATENALKQYDSLNDWNLNTSSSGAMTVALKQAIENEEEVVITGWSPHWMFATYDLKYLNDPKEIFGGIETINTMVRKNLKTDMPEAYKVLDQFNWTTEDIETVMLAISEGEDPKDAAKAWINDHPEEVTAWTKDVKK